MIELYGNLGRMHNQYEQPIRKRVPEISALMSSDRQPSRGAGTFIKCNSQWLTGNGAC